LVKAIDKACKKAKGDRKAWDSSGKNKGVAPIADKVVGYDLEREREIRESLGGYFSSFFTLPGLFVTRAVAPRNNQHELSLTLEFAD
jgi:hypothetical protein